MGAITAELVETGERRGSGGRRVMPAERRAALLEEYGRSGLTMMEFARREGIKYPTFAGWVHKAGPRARTKPAIKFAEVRMTAPAGPEALEVRLPDGAVVRGGKVAEIIAVVRALRA